MKTHTAVTPIWNGLDGLINDKPFMPGVSPARQAMALMELAEQDGERLGSEERRLIIDYADKFVERPYYSGRTAKSKAESVPKPAPKPKGHVEGQLSLLGEVD